MLYDMRLAFISTAQLLGDYQSMSVDELANGYCAAVDAKDYFARDKYLSALVLRFWYRIEKIYQPCKNVPEFTRESACEKLCECINVACEYRGWQDPTKGLNAQQCILQVIGTRGVPAVIYDSNRQKNKINVNTVSLDDPRNDDDNAEVTLMDTIEDDSRTADHFLANEAVQSIVQRYLNKNKIIEAIIIDSIAFHDFEKVKKTTESYVNEEGKTVKYASTTRSFWAYKCAMYLADLPDSYKDYFTDKYVVADTDLDVALRAVHSASKQKLHRYIKATLADVKRVLTV